MQSRIKDINAIPIAYSISLLIICSKVPLIGFQIDGISVDLAFVSVDKYLLSFPSHFSIFDDTMDSSMDESVRTMMQLIIIVCPFIEWSSYSKLNITKN